MKARIQQEVFHIEEYLRSREYLIIIFFSLLIGAFNHDDYAFNYQMADVFYRTLETKVFSLMILPFLFFLYSLRHMTVNKTQELIRYNSYFEHFKNELLTTIIRAIITIITVYLCNFVAVKILDYMGRVHIEDLTYPSLEEKAYYLEELNKAKVWVLTLPIIGLTTMKTLMEVLYFHLRKTFVKILAGVVTVLYFMELLDPNFLERIPIIQKIWFIFPNYYINIDSSFFMKGKTGIVIALVFQVFLLGFFLVAVYIERGKYYDR